MRVSTTYLELRDRVLAWNSDSSKKLITDFSTRTKTLFVWKKVYISIVEGKVGFVELSLFQRAIRYLFKYHANTILKKETRDKVVTDVREILEEISRECLKTLPREIWMYGIFSKLSPNDLKACARVCKAWTPLVRDPLVRKNAILYDTILGKAMWEKYIGNVEEEPPLPPDIFKRLTSECSLNPGKKVYETCKVVWFPKTVNGKAIKDEQIKTFMRRTLTGEPPKQWRTIIDPFKQGGPKGDQPCWDLITEDVAPSSSC